MHISEIHIEGYKNFGLPFAINLHKGLNVIVGENATGKTAIVNCIRHLLREDEYSHTRISESDFNKPFRKSSSPAQQIRFSAKFTKLTQQEKVAFLPWTDEYGDAFLTMLVHNKQDYRGRYKRDVWGGKSKSSHFEWELFDAIQCVYLPPLRDAERQLSEGKSSRLARLIRNLEQDSITEAAEQGQQHDLAQQVSVFNEQLANDEEGPMFKANRLIRTGLLDALGPVLSQDTTIQFTDSNFNSIVESLRLLFYPTHDNNIKSNQFRSLEENSLGYNNILYLATILAELTSVDKNESYLRVLLVEEPEAHLHPQLQVRLLRYLQEAANEKDVQIIVTTHSPVLASSTSLESIIHLSESISKPYAVGIKSCKLTEGSKLFLERWLDVTKSTLLFAKGIILVEGISEAIVFPELARMILHDHPGLPKSLDDAGISVVNMNGIYFKHFMQLFVDINNSNSHQLPIRCAGVTDVDPPRDSHPTPSNRIDGNNPAHELVDKVSNSEWCRLYVGDLKTFEYDLAFCGSNLTTMASILAANWPTDGDIREELQHMADTEVSTLTEEQKGELSFALLNRIENNHMGKGQFAQLLAEQLAQGIEFQVPGYIDSAVVWACGGNPDES